MKNHFIIIVFSLCCSLVYSQTRIDGSFAFQTDPSKKYSLYIPSAYDENIPHRLMIGFHPLNTARWNAESWCDTLIVFAETNNLILACPDGGIDGAVDDPIDTAFTSVLIDSIYSWYNIDPEKVYAMGFSVGGKTTYTYGLNHIWEFRGFIPIGAAVNGTSEVNAVIQNAEGKPYYLVHGANDSPSTRFTPVKTALEDNNALVNFILMSGVGHTIDFPNRNQILTTAFEWVDSVNCAQVTAIYEKTADFLGLKLFPNPVANGQSLMLFSDGKINETVDLKITGTDGKIVAVAEKQTIEKGNNTIQVSLNGLAKGLYFLQIFQDRKLIRSLPFVLN
jgi:poly(3-hydroxybutyrate) depolymerase